MSFDIINAEQCFSKDMNPYTLISGEFNVFEPYFQERQGTPKKKQRKSPSITDVETEKRHEELRPLLTNCIDKLQAVWPKREQKSTKSKEIKNEIDFPSIQSMVESAHNRFTSQHDERIELPEEGDDDAAYRDLDIFSVFNKICINSAQRLKQIEITPSAKYLIPPRSSFIMGSMTDSSLQQLSDYVSSLGGADLIIIDPPWPNKSVHRSSKYETQDIYDLFTIPMKDMINVNSVVAVWVTNKPKFRKFIIHKLFPAWELECKAEWVWLKVTTEGQCIFPLDSSHKKPYEQLIIGHRQKTSDLPSRHVIVSVPSLRHSRKPPLQDVILPYLKNKDRPVCVEMFARCLTPGWISWGNECLKFQHTEYFEKKAS
ncbi:hypothetical protein RMATCC62417_10014 [Rhizopus microsporus]|nr:hypothetical protein RMATCC62417_10014 [Rhizopus microsporus]